MLAGLAGWQGVNSTTAKSSAPLRIGVQNSVPYQWLDADGQPRGLAVELIQRAAEREGIALEWVYSPRSPDAHFADGSVDLWPALVHLPEREGYIYISAPYFENAPAVLCRADRGIQGLDDLKGHTLAYFNREPAISIVSTLAPDATLQPVDTHLTAIQRVCEGKSDAALIWSTKANSILYKRLIDQYPNVAFDFYPVRDRNIRVGVAAAVHNPQARRAADRLRAGIRELALEGEVEAIYLRHYLDPENEVSSYFRAEALQQDRNRLAIVSLVLTLAVGVLAWVGLKLRHAQRVADAANQAKTAFLANMSHEIRTPLHGILAMTELAREKPASAEQADMLLTISQSGNMLLKIVNDILDLSRVEAGRTELTPTPLELTTFVHSSTRAFLGQCRQCGLELVSQIDPALPRTILADEVRLRQVVFNLLGNAIKYTPRGAIHLRAQRLHHPVGDRLRLEVTDTGIGISPTDQVRIFEAFTQVDAASNRRYGGTGLGLTLSRRLVHLMGGEISLESTPGQGSTFRIDLPLIEATAPALENTPDALPPSGDHLRKAQSLRILVVDDNPVNLKVACVVLRKHGHLVEPAASGADALAALERTSFQLVLMDIQMPGMDGIEVTRRIRARESTGNHRTPIVALTACALQDKAAECFDAGMDGYLTKPFKIQAFLDEIARIHIVTQRGQA